MILGAIGVKGRHFRREIFDCLCGDHVSHRCVFTFELWICWQNAGRTAIAAGRAGAVAVAGADHVCLGDGGDVPAAAPVDSDPPGFHTGNAHAIEGSDSAGRLCGK